MALGVRGANPIWMEFDLQGNLFDDNFYMYVLQNVLPYAPATVYRDPDLNTEWDNPIQFLGNGTLPNNIYFETDKVYRLEFRQNNGLQAPSQNDPLIYEVDDYVAGTGGSTPVDTVALASSNQVTNPQFALISFSSPFSLLSATNPAPIAIGPGWFLDLTGTGNVTITQVELNSSNANPSNAPYALQLTLSGWSTVTVRQRFQQNGMLWANKYVSSAITARLNGLPQSISAALFDSQGAPLGTVLDSSQINESWNQFTGYAKLPATTNTDLPPSAYVDYRLSLPNNADIYITSIALVVQDLPIEPGFEQDSIDRQIDHTYHIAYPIVPVGGVIMYHGFGSPAHFFDCTGNPLSRTDYNLLFQAVTRLETVTLTSGSANITVANGAIYGALLPVEGVGLQAMTAIASISGNVVTLNKTATATGPAILRFFTVGAGDGTTTFNLPSFFGRVPAQAFGTLFPTSGVGTIGGESTHTLIIDEMPDHNHPGSTYGNNSTANGGSTTSYGAFQPANQNFVVNVAHQGGGLPHNNVQQTFLTRFMIRYE